VGSKNILAHFFIDFRKIVSKFSLHKAWIEIVNIEKVWQLTPCKFSYLTYDFNKYESVSVNKSKKMHFLTLIAHRLNRI